MEEENKNAYSEVIAVLKLLDDEKRLEALPMETLELLKSKANPEYNPTFSKEISLEEQNLLPETLSILSWIAMKYWNNEIEEQNEAEVFSIEEENEEKDAEQILNNTEEINSKTDEEIENDVKQEEIEEVIEEKNNETEGNDTLPILYKDLKWYQKIKIKIIEFFNRIFKKNINVQKNKEEGKSTL